MKVRVRLGENVGGSGYGIQKRYGDEMRGEYVAKRLEREKKEEIRRLGLEEDLSVGEDKWRECFERQVPYVEWWDKEVGDITSYVLHPVLEWKEESVVEKVRLTKEVQRKLRRGRRREKVERMRDLERLGLKESSGGGNGSGNGFLRSEYEIERVAKRVKHDEMNLQRKEEAKKEKEVRRLEKLERDLSNGVYMCVVRFGEGVLNDGKMRYKVNVTGREMGVVGVCCCVRGGDGRGVAVFQGGRVAVEKYRRVVGGIGEVLWMGEVVRKVFYKWSFYEYGDVAEIAEFLKSRSGSVCVYQSYIQ